MTVNNNEYVTKSKFIIAVTTPREYNGGIYAKQANSLRDRETFRKTQMEETDKKVG